MDKSILVKQHNGKTYKVYYDEDGYSHAFEGPYALDFETEAQKEELIYKLRKGILAFYTVVESELCQCCSQLIDKDSLSGLLCTSPEIALEDYMYQVGAL